jgi:hypothetical protein
MKSTLLNALQEVDAVIRSRKDAIPGCSSKYVNTIGKIMMDLQDRSFARADFSVHWERGWGVNASLEVKIRTEPNSPSKITKGHSEKVWDMTIGINISASTYSVHAAVSYAALLRDVAELGAIIQTIWDQYEVPVE